MRKTYVYILQIKYPSEPNKASNYYEEIQTINNYFHWPRNRKFLSEKGAKTRASVLRDLGCEVEIYRSDPVTFTSINKNIIKDLRKIESLYSEF